MKHVIKCSAININIKNSSTIQELFSFHSLTPLTSILTLFISNFDQKLETNTVHKIQACSKSLCGGFTVRPERLVGHSHGLEIQLVQACFSVVDGGLGSGGLVG